MKEAEMKWFENITELYSNTNTGDEDGSNRKSTLKKYSRPTNEIQCSILWEKFKRNIIKRLKEIQLSNN